MNIQLIKEVFSALPAKPMITLAKKIQQDLLCDQTLAQKTKGEDEWGWVTKADYKIQKMVLNYFENSTLKGTYKIIAEEELDRNQSRTQYTWQLLIDPLDGTSAFRKQKETWGIMVGACDMAGNLVYSWNIVSTGDVFTSSCKPLLKQSFTKMVTGGKTLTIDVYDYGSGAAERFGSYFEQQFKISSSKCLQTSYPAAIWTGYKLFTGELNGMLWLPSDKGKKWYPDYDLIFLDSVKQRGYSIIIGKEGKENAMIVIASTKKDAESLKTVGQQMLSSDKRSSMRFITNTLEIASGIS